MTCLDLYVPSLFAFSKDQLLGIKMPELAGLSKILSHGDRQKTPTKDYLSEVSVRLNYPDAGEVPAGALTAQAYKLARSNKYYLRADPVHFQIGGEGAVVVPPEAMRLTPEEADQFIGFLDPYLRDQGLRIFAARADAWVVEIETEQDLITTPVYEVASSNAERCFPQGKSARFWQTLSTEIQMLLHEFTANTERADRNELAINSVWFWGYGELPSPGVKKYAFVNSDDCCVQGLADLAESEFSNDFTDLGTQFEKSGDTLVTVVALQKAHGLGDLHAWLEALLDLDQVIFEPLMANLRAKKN